MLDVVVAGKGPAALAAAAALGERGLAVGVLGPPGPVSWPARYGAWLDELEGAGHAGSVSASWPAAVVDTGGVRRHRLERGYAFIDNAALSSALVARCEGAGVRWIAAEAASARHEAAFTWVTFRGGSGIDARVVVDATGHAPALVRNPSSPTVAFRAAVGWRIEAPAIDVPRGAMLLMDWRDGHLDAGDDPGAPTFLHACREPDGRVYVEEASLAARPAISFDRLEGRLRRRLASLGAEGAAPLSRERVWIPVGGRLPDPSQRVVGFGAAAGMVHPATGYSVARSLAAAPALADAVARGLGRAAGSPAEAARDAWRALWPRDALRRNALYRFGVEMLLGLDAAQTRAFFDAFYRLPRAEWGGYLSDTLPPRAFARAMARLFALLPPDLRLCLARRGASSAALAMADGIAATLRGPSWPPGPASHGGGRGALPAVLPRAERYYVSGGAGRPAHRAAVRHLRAARPAARRFSLRIPR